MVERKQHHTDADWSQYVKTIDAITGRKPERMKPNGMDMLRAKVMQIEDAGLRNDAWKAYDELAISVEEVA